ncbi:MAG: tripartite tricarboxylate transporter substrate binding protein [Deltaproteobacteria bacterium]|nr:tripartite tricarboxylate transporter substrate binding protein [Deltaproteobacteria bacterium]
MTTSVDGYGFKFVGLRSISIKQVVAILATVLLWSQGAWSQTPFYQGKTIRIVVGFLAGDGYDRWARIVANHMGRHLPGNPDFIVQNMPGAGGLISANYVYAVAKPDGLTWGGIGGPLYLDQLTGRPDIQFDWGKFSWIGSPEKTTWLLYMRSDSPYKSIEDVRKAQDPPRCSATGTGSSGYFVPRLLEETIGAKFKIVVGYKGGGEQDLALERGEVQCRALSIPTFLSREPFQSWRKRDLVRVLLQTGRKRDPRLPDVPTIYELMDEYKTPESGRRLLSVILASGNFGRPLVAPPGLPPDRLKLLREAFMKTVRDPQFVTETTKKKLEAEPGSGDELEALAKEVVGHPREVVERMKKVLGE